MPGKTLSWDHLMAMCTFRSSRGTCDIGIRIFKYFLAIGYSVLKQNFGWCIGGLYDRKFWTTRNMIFDVTALVDGLVNLIPLFHQHPPHNVLFRSLLKHRSIYELHLTNYNTKPKYGITPSRTRTYQTAN